MKRRSIINVCLIILLIFLSPFLLFALFVRTYDYFLCKIERPIHSITPELVETIQDVYGYKRFYVPENAELVNGVHYGFGEAELALAFKVDIGHIIGAGSIYLEDKNWKRRFDSEIREMLFPNGDVEYESVQLAPYELHTPNDYFENDATYTHRFLPYYFAVTPDGYLHCFYRITHDPYGLGR